MIKLNDHTQDLTIRNIQNKHSGDYELEINNSSTILHRKFHIAVSELPQSSGWKITGIVLAAVLLIGIVIVIVIMVCIKCVKSGGTDPQTDSMQPLKRDPQQHDS